MEFSFTSALMDGTLRNPFVRLCVVLSTLAILVPSVIVVTVLTRRPSTKTRLLAVTGATLLLAVLCSRLVFNETVSAYANLGTDVHVGICFMPTNLWYRDFLPGALAGLLSSSFAFLHHWVRTRTSGRPTPDSAVNPP
jgi:hypothetical protein